jgi:hypothetical protein
LVLELFGRLIFEGDLKGGHRSLSAGGVRASNYKAASGANIQISFSASAGRWSSRKFLT